MPTIHPTEAIRHQLGGSTFDTYVAPSTGAEQLCAWRLEVRPATPGLPHRPSNEEVLLVLEGVLCGELDGAAFALRPGEVLHVPAGAQVRIDGGERGATAWVTTSVGLHAITEAGERIDPPWAQ